MITSDSRQVVFIDSRVPDIADLINGVQPDVSVFVLDPDSDGVQQIADILAANNLQDLSSISIVSHGAPGEIQLGSSVLSDASLPGYSTLLADIGATLAPGCDIALYGCDVASGAGGMQFISDLSAYTGGASVAASTHDIGSTPSGENWLLDASVGSVVAPAPFTDAALATYQGVLNSPEFRVPVETFGNLDGGVDPGALKILTNGDVVIPFFFANNTNNVAFGVFDQNGNRIGSEIQEPTPSAYNPIALQGSTSNSFWIVSDIFTPNNPANVGNFTQVLATPYTINGSTITPGTAKTIIDSPNGDDNESVSVTQLSNGDYVVAWAFTTADFSSGATKVEVFDQNFNALGPITTISTGASSTPFTFNVNVTANGSAVDVVYHPNTGTNFGVSFNVAANGSISGLTTPVNLTAALPSGAQLWQQSELPGGKILVLYTDAQTGNTGGNLFGEVFNAGFTGTPTPFQIANSTPVGNGVYEPGLAKASIFASGDYIVTYERPTGAHEQEIYGRLYDSNNNPLTNEFLVTVPSNNVENGFEFVDSSNGGTGGLAFAWMVQDFQSFQFPPQDEHARFFSDVGPTSSGGTSSVTSVLEDAATINGETLSSLITGNQYVSVLGHAFGGIAIDGNAATAAQGAWQYFSGGVWHNIATNVSDTNATIVAAGDAIRFNPVANYNGTPGGLTVRVWDGQDGFSADTIGQNISSFIFDTSDVTQTTASFTGAFAGTTVAFGTSITAVNDPPQGTDNTKTINENTSYTFAAGDFGFSDPLDANPPSHSGGNNFKDVIITTLPAAGSLTLNGAAVAVGQSILVGNIPNLVFTPAANANGHDYASFTFQVQDDGGTANGGVDLDPSPKTFTFNVIAAPVLSTTPSPSTVTLGPAPVTLTDSAVLANGAGPTGTITFTLFYNGGNTPVDTETVIVNGNGTYTTPTGFTLPGGSTATGTYQWDATYTGDPNNIGTSDSNNPNEQVTISPASPALSTTPAPVTVTLGPTPVTLTDSAVLAGGFNPSGTITFTLFYNGGNTPLDTETVAVNGNGTYTTPTGFTLLGGSTATGTYQWDATYTGDSNNNATGDLNNPTEQVTVSAAPVFANAGNVVAYTERQTSPSAVPVDNGITVTDVVSPTLKSAKVQITSGAFAGDVLNADTTGTAITAVWNGTDTLTLTGSDTLADYQHVLRSVAFDSSSHNPTNFGAGPSRTVTWTATDDLGAASSPVTSTINVTAVNDAPVLGNVVASVRARLNAQAITLSPGLTVSDVDNTTLASATVQVAGGSGDVLAANVSGTVIAANYNPATETLVLSGADTLAHYQQVLDSVTYQSTGGSSPRTVTWVLSDGGAANNLSTPATTSINFGLTPDNFGGNGLSGVLWRQATSEILVQWSMNGPVITASQLNTYLGTPIQPDASWNELGTADFNGDGKTDILWQHNDGALAIWSMNGSVISNGGFVTSQGQTVHLGPSWSLAGTGDFNGDGNADMLWRNSNGSLAEWLMNGTTITASQAPTFQGNAVSPDQSWSVVAMGDFNGDGHQDMLWRNSNGSLQEWLMNGSTITSSQAPTFQGSAVSPDSSWSVIAAGDFNGDGMTDLLWRQSGTGALMEWMMNGSQITSSQAVSFQGKPLTTPDASWSLVEIGDFNGDGKSDALWRQSTTGALSEWLMNGSQVTAVSTVTSSSINPMLDASWQVQSKPTNFA